MLDIFVLSGTVLAGLPLFFVMPLVALGVMTANLLASPVEKAVQRWYINDAARILAQRGRPDPYRYYRQLRQNQLQVYIGYNIVREI